MYGYVLNSRLSSGKRLHTRCLNRLRSLAKAALTRSGEIPTTVVDQVSAAADSLETLLDNLDFAQCIWEYETNKELLGIVSSYALALRRSALSSGASASERAAFTRLRSQLAMHLASFKNIWRHVDFSLEKYKLLTSCMVRSQALRCYAALLAECAAGLAPQRAAGAPEHSSTDVVSVLREVCDMLETLASPVEKPNPGYDVVLAELRQELIRSRLLEHWSRTLLLLYFSRSQHGASEEELAGLTERMGVILSLQGGLCRNGLLTLEDHSLGYLISSHLVRLAAVMDGGTTYGMPEAFVAPLTPSGPVTDAQGSTVSTQDIVLAQSALSAWYAVTVETRSLLNGSSQQLSGLISAVGSSSVRDAANRRLAQLQQQLEQLDDQLQGAAAEQTAPWGFAPMEAGAGVGPRSVSDLQQQIQDLERNIARVQTVLKSLAVPPLNLPFMRDVALRLAVVAVDVLQAADASEAAAMTTPTVGGACTVGAGGSAMPGATSDAQLQQQERDPVQHVQQQPREQQHGRHGQQLKRHSSAVQVQLDKPRLDQSILLGLKALMCAREALWDVGWAPTSETPAAKLAQLVDWWKRVVEFGSLVARRGPRPDNGLWRWVELAPLLVLRAAHNSASMSISLAPSADVVEALRHGYLRVVEQLLRKSEGSRGLMVHLIIESNTFPWRQALAYGESSHVAALVSTIAKVVRRDIIELLAAEAVAAKAEAEAETAVAMTAAKEGTALQRALSRRREARGQATATLAAATGLLGPEWSVLLIMKHTKQLQQLEKEEAAAAAGKAVKRVEGAAAAAAHVDRDAAPASGGAGLVQTASGSACSGGSAVAAATRKTTEDVTDDGDRRHCSDQDVGTGGKEGAGVSPSVSAIPVGLETYYCTGASELRVVISRIGQNLSHAAARLLPNVCELAVRLAETAWLDDDSGMMLTHAWVIANTTAFVELTAVLTAAVAGKMRTNDSKTQRSDGTRAAAGGGVKGGSAPAAEVAPATVGIPGPVGDMGQSVAAAWDRLLNCEVGTVRQLHLGTYLFETLDPAELESSGLLKQWTQALRALSEWSPEQLAALVESLGSAEALKGPGSRVWTTQLRVGGPGPFGLPGPGDMVRGLQRVRQLIGPGGKRPDAVLMATVERVCSGEPGPASSVDLTARRADSAAEDSETQGSILEKMRAGWPYVLGNLISAEDAFSLLPVCSNPRCTSLAGDSEEGQRLMGCARCGGRVRYCCRECQVAHWKAGHKVECAGGLGAGNNGLRAAAAAGAADLKD